MAANSQDFPELFRPADTRWASRAAARGEIRRLARGLYTTNLDEPAERLLRRRWHRVAALYFPDAVIVDRSAILAGPAEDGSVFLDIGAKPINPRPVKLPGLALRPRNGPGPVTGDMEFGELRIASPARALLENLRPSRARAGVRRTLQREELEDWLARQASVRGDAELNELRDQAGGLAPELDAESEMRTLDQLIGTMLGTRESSLKTRGARARAAGRGYDTDRLELFEVLRSELALQPIEARPEPTDPERLFAFYEAYLSNWIEGTIFEVDEAAKIVFEGKTPPDRPADAHDIQGTFEAITHRRFRQLPPTTSGELEDFLWEAHSMVMGGRPEVAPGQFKSRVNKAGATTFVHPDLVAGTLREGYELMAMLPAGFPRAAFAMFMVTEVHPFADGNGRVARILMNAELSSQSLTRILVPLSYRQEYMGALKALSQNSNPTPLIRMLDRAQRWASLIAWGDRDRLAEQLERTNALVEPDRAEAENLVLLDPPA